MFAMKKISLFAAGICSICLSFAQTNDYVRVRAGEPVVTGAYRFKEFIQGFVYYKNGNISSGRLNFNMFAEEMHFIDGNNDTLAIANPLTISSIVLDTNRFYYFKDGYLEVFSHYDSIEVAGKLRVKSNKEKVGAYGQANPTASIDTYTSITDRNRVYALSPNEDITLFKDVSYYFIENKKHALKATKANLFKLFPGKKDSIEKYLVQHPVNFKNITDIKQLLLHITGL